MTAPKKKKKRKARPAEGEVRAAPERRGQAEKEAGSDRTIPIIVGVLGAIAIATWLIVTLNRDDEPQEWAEVEQDTGGGDEAAGGDPTATPPDVSAPPAGSESSASGLHWRVLRPGTGTRHPAATDRVRVHYAGWRAEDGELFDSSYERNQPATFPLNQVIAGWTEVVQLMVEGEKRRVWIPANLAYEGRPGAPQGMLVFDIELLEIL